MGRVTIRDCPWRRIGTEHLQAIDATLAMEFGILPEAGGMADQSATFVAAFPLLLSELVHWRNVANQQANKA